MQQNKMSTFFLACLLFTILLAGAEAKEKQIKLEDIERDNLAAEKHANQQQYHQQAFGYQPTSQLHSPGNYYLPNTPDVRIPNVVKIQNNQQYAIQNRHQHYQHQEAQVTNPPKMQYGFVPIKPMQYQQSHQHQVEQHSQPIQYQYVPTHSHTEAYLPQPEKQLQSPRVPYAAHQYPPEEENLQNQHRYAGIKIPIQTQPYQQYIKSVQPQHHSALQHHTQIQHIPENQLQLYYQNQPQSHYQPALSQYIVDNSIQTDSQDAQKYYQQYVYFHPYQTPSASSNINSVSDTKGNVQYVMYIPADAAYPRETVLAYPTNQETQYSYQSVLDPTPQINIKSPLTTGVTGLTLKHSSVPSVKPRIHLAHAVKTPKRIERPVFKPQPTSLLDSYVPSYLQFQFYKQQQAENANAIKQSLKVGRAQDIEKN